MVGENRARREEACYRVRTSESRPTLTPTGDRGRAYLSKKSMAPIHSLIAFSLVLAAACGSDPQPPPETPIDVDKTGDIDANTKKRGKGDQKDDGSTANVKVDERIRKMCALPEAHFDFDSAAVGASAKSMLDALASCFLGGPAKDSNMLVVGHADPRGETEYNFALGQRRAGTVAGYLLKAGLGDARVSTSSRGELEATGGDEAGWARDRRVEILLAE